MEQQIADFQLTNNTAALWYENESLGDAEPTCELIAYPETRGMAKSFRNSWMAPKNGEETAAGWLRLCPSHPNIDL